jgi:hypothetical protein
MAESGNAKKGAKKYLDFLAEEGFRPQINANGDVAFKYEGGNYLIKIDEKDEAFFYLAYPNFWRIASDKELVQVKEAALAVTAANKVVKIFPVKDTDTWATIELFCSPSETFKAVFDRCLRSLRGAVEDFKAKMKEMPEETDDFVFHLPKYNVGAN